MGFPKKPRFFFSFFVSLGFNALIVQLVEQRFCTPYVEGSIPSGCSMIQIYRKEGFILNPKDKVVNNIIRLATWNNGLCPCQGNTSKDKYCPCSNYKEKGICCCGLYVK